MIPILHVRFKSSILSLLASFHSISSSGSKADDCTFPRMALALPFVRTVKLQNVHVTHLLRPPSHPP